MPPKSIQRNDIEVLDRNTNEDRRIMIEAAIVRIMKAHGTLKYVLLIQEVIRQVRSYFKPQIPMIKVSLFAKLRSNLLTSCFFSCALRT